MLSTSERDVMTLFQEAQKFSISIVVQNDLPVFDVDAVHTLHRSFGPFSDLNLHRDIYDATLFVETETMLGTHQTLPLASMIGTVRSHYHTLNVPRIKRRTAMATDGVHSH